MKKKTPIKEKVVVKDHMKMEKIYLEALVPYKNNAKKHPESQIKDIMLSIEESGYNDPIAIDEDNEIIEGHGRCIALNRLNTDGRFDRIQVIRLTGLTDVQKKRYRIAHNKINMQTGFDNELLNEEFEMIEDAGFDLGSTGFTNIEVGEMRDKIQVSQHERKYHNKEFDEEEIAQGLDQECPKCKFRFKGNDAKL